VLPEVKPVRDGNNKLRQFVSASSRDTLDLQKMLSMVRDLVTAAKDSADASPDPEWGGEVCEFI